MIFYITSIYSDITVRIYILIYLLNIQVNIRILLIILTISFICCSGLTCTGILAAVPGRISGGCGMARIIGRMCCGRCCCKSRTLKILMMGCACPISLSFTSNYRESTSLSHRTQLILMFSLRILVFCFPNLNIWLEQAKKDELLFHVSMLTKNF